jgi:hypothetical protein
MNAQHERILATVRRRRIKRILDKTDAKTLSWQHRTHRRMMAWLNSEFVGLCWTLNESKKRLIPHV